MRANPILACLFLGAGIAAAAAELKVPRLFALDLKPGKVHEECLTIAKGANIDFEWSATQPVDFNIHFHRGDEVSYPVKADNARQKKGRFSPGAKEDYCWMWTAKSATRLTGRLNPAK
jgi:hypothetical protein